VTGGLPRGLAANPRLSRWVGVAADGTITVRVGKVELGQGILTALAQIAADELGVTPERIRMLAASTADGPDEGLTAGSRSVADSGAALRQACAEVRALFLAEAVASLGLDPDTATVHNGVFGDARETRGAGYGELAARVCLDRDATGGARPRDAAAAVGTSTQRIDLPDKIAGRARYIHDLRLPGQLAGRVVRPPSPGASLRDAGTAAILALPGVVSVVEDGRFLGVVATGEAAADHAAAALAAGARWLECDTLPDEDALPAYLRSVPSEAYPVGEAGEGPEQPVAATLRASYSRPFLAHASIAPSCGAARWDGEDVEVWTHSQGIYPLRAAIATALGLAAERVTVRHVEGAGSYGHNGADDAAFDAVLLARSVPGQPVLVRWSRSDELSWAPFGSAMAIDLEAGVDAGGNVATWSHEVWSNGHVARPGYAGSPGLLGAAHLARPFALPPAVNPPPANGHGAARNAIPGYAFPHWRVRGHRALRAPLRASSLRSLGAYANVFAIESFMDELALAAGRDPLTYRLDQLTDPRGRAVLRAAADLGRWERRGTEENVGLGIGYARYKGDGAWCAVVAEVAVTHEIRVRRLAVAVDVGRVVNPDGVRNQLEGGAIQAASWTLKERVRFDRRRVTSVDWESYPILRFSEAPTVDVEVVSRPDEPSVGAGEAAQGPTAAAIGNAVADALGVRVRDLPITAGRVLSAIEET
jgi:nicotinate dehydrogenase subunit B